MVVFPIAAAVLAFACALTILLDYLRRARPDKIVWVVAFAMFGGAALAKVLADIFGWTPLLARSYYVLGATLVVGYLALGELYLMLPRRWADRAAGGLVALTALAGALAWRAEVAPDIGEVGWEALERGPALTALTIGFNALGTLVLVGGCLYSAIRFRRLGIMHNRTVGLMLIAVGTLVVAAGGTLTRLGSEQYFYIAMALGVGLIYAGYLRARAPAARRGTIARPGWLRLRRRSGAEWCASRLEARPYRRRTVRARVGGSPAPRRDVERTPR